MVATIPANGFRTFSVIWLGQLVSLIGSGLTSFALGVWVYQKTGSATHFAFISLATTFPIVALSLISGPLVDRWDRRKVLIASDCVAAGPTVVVALLLMSGRLEIWHIYLAVGISSSSTAFQWPAYTATTTLLVPKQHLARAAGMVEFSRAGAMILSPMLAGVLMVYIDIWGIILIDTLTFLAAISTLLVMRVPTPERSREGAQPQSSLWQEARFGWVYLLARPGLVRLLAYFSFMNFSVALVLGLTTPMMLSFTTAAVLGMTLSVGALGMLLGGVVLSVWGGPNLKVHGILGFGLLLGAGLALAGMHPAPLLITFGLFWYNFSIPIINGCSQAIWQSKIPPELQGRVFAIRRMFATFTAPLGYLVAGPLADRLFEPMLATGGALAGSFGQLIGVGPGRGIGLIFILQGLLSIGVAGVGFLSPRLMRVEAELPDAVDAVDANPANEPPDDATSDTASLGPEAVSAKA